MAKTPAAQLRQLPPLAQLCGINNHCTTMATSKNSTDAGKPRIRTLKVCARALVRQQCTYNSYTIVMPQLKLMGNWLERCGFHCGQYVDVTMERNKLTITHSWTEDVDDDEDDQPASATTRGE